MPRFAFEKFPGAEPILSTAMKSVGEAMAIGRSFQESLQKALLAGNGPLRLREVEMALREKSAVIKARSASNARTGCAPLPRRCATGMSDDEIHRNDHIDPWFLRQIR